MPVLCENPADPKCSGRRPTNHAARLYNHWDLQKTAGRWEIVRQIGKPIAPGVASDVLNAWREPKRVP